LGDWEQNIGGGIEPATCGGGWSDGGEEGDLEHPEEPEGEEPLSVAAFCRRGLAGISRVFCFCMAAAQFMQRGAAAQKVEEKAKVEVQEEVVTAPSGGFSSSAQVVRKWYGDFFSLLL